jgi:hypothetical protein
MGDVASKGGVLGAINDAHPAFTQLFGDVIPAERAADQRHRKDRIQ